MRKFCFTLVLLALSVFVLAQHESQRYAIKSGYIEYEISGNTTGTRSIWWDDYGVKSRTEENTVNVTRILGIRNETRINTVSIINGDKFWTADLIEQTGETGTIPSWVGGYEYGTLSESDRKEFEKEILEAYGGRIVGQETLMGYECDIVDVFGTKSWIYKGIALKTEANILGIRVKELAVKFDKNANVPASRFEPPAGIKYSSMDDIDMNIFRDGFDAFMDDDYDYYDDYDDEDIIPLDYPYDRFRDVVNGFTYGGYNQLMGYNDDGQYIATFLRGNQSISIIASSSENEIVYDEEDQQGFEVFRHDGKQFYYGHIEDDEASVLIEEYPREKMYIIYMAVPPKSKDALLRIAGSLKF